MRILTADFETYYDSEYSLKKMPTTQYVRDPRFYIYGCAIKIDDDDTAWIPGPRIKQFIHNYKPDIIVGHRILFDGTIWTEKFNLRPTTYWVDTIGLVRAIVPHLSNYDLDSLSKFFGGEGKVKQKALTDLKGVRTPTPQQFYNLGEYAIDDCNDAHWLFERHWPMLPEKERKVMHLTIRAGVEPKLIVDINKLTKARNTEITTRKTTIRESGLPEKTLTSNDKFAEWIKSNGMEVPTKISKTTKKRTTALAQGDIEYAQLIANNPNHAKVWAGRKAAKSNILITRANRILDVGRTGPFPMPYNYYAAHTGRAGGTDKLNVANLPRGSEMRRSITAPEGKLITAGDSGQIELRKNCWFSKQNDVLELFRSGNDVYKSKAAEMLGKRYDEIEDHERFLEKVRQLGLGYRMGWKVYQTLCALGPYGNDPIYFNNAEAKAQVDGYRAVMDRIAAMWKILDGIIPGMSQPDYEYEIHPVKFAYQRVELPNGMLLQYPNLRYDDNDRGYGSWIYSKQSFLHGGSLLENIIQALARIVVLYQMIEIDKHPLIFVVGQTYDEIISLVDETHATECEQYIIEQMKIPQPWCRNLPLDADAKTDKVYAK